MVMKTKLTLALLLAFILGSVQPAEARQNRQLKIQVNQQKKISGSRLSLKFVSVPEDSRCPEDANCVWAGNAKIQIKLRKSKGAWKTFELNSNTTDKTVKFEGYEIKLIDLDPKPRTNTGINRNSYTATFLVEKSAN